MQNIATWLQVCAELIMALVACYGAAVGLPILRDRVALARRTEDAEKAARAYKEAAEGWESRVGSLTNELAGLRQEVHEMQTQLGAAIVYITDLIVQVRMVGSPDDIPVPPKELWGVIASVAPYQQERH